MVMWRWTSEDTLKLSIVLFVAIVLIVLLFIAIMKVFGVSFWELSYFILRALLSAALYYWFFVVKGYENKWSKAGALIIIFWFVVIKF